MSCSTRHLPSCTPSSPFGNRASFGTPISHRHSKDRGPAMERSHPATGIYTITPTSVSQRHQEHCHVYRHKGQHQGSPSILQPGRAPLDHSRATSPSLTRARFESLWVACLQSQADRAKIGLGRLLECVEDDNFLTRLVREPTGEGSPLDPLFTNREGLVGGMMAGGRLGHSNHEMMQLLIPGGVRKGGASRTATLGFRRADLGLLRGLVDRVPREAGLKGKGGQEGWTFFKEELRKAPEQAVPVCRKTSRRGRRPVWWNRELWLELRKKTQRAYVLWQKGQATQEDYKDVVRLRRAKSRRPKPSYNLIWLLL